MGGSLDISDEEFQVGIRVSISILPVFSVATPKVELSSLPRLVPIGEREISTNG